MSKVNIALCGKFRSGKDTVGIDLCEKYGYTRFAFGTRLKHYYHELFGNSDEKPREGYQWFGQVMRQREPDIWIRKLFEDITYFTEVFDMTGPVVITDLRQPNEFAALKSRNFIIIRVNCPDNIRIERSVNAGDSFKSEDLHHETESHIDLFEVDYDIYNVGTVEELYAQVDLIMTHINGGGSD